MSHLDCLGTRSGKIIQRPTQNQSDRVKVSTRSTPISTTVKFGIDSSQSGRLHPVLPTGTQDDEDKEHGVGVPTSLVGCLGTCGELGSPHKMSESCSTTMVRVPGSSGDSGFHRESRDENVKIKTDYETEASAEEISPQKCEEKGSLDHQSSGRDFDDKILREEDRSLDLKDKPQIPL